MDKVIIIAEAGVNHNGDIALAKELIVEASLAGADYVKFQTAVPELVVSTFAPKAEYQKETTGSGSQLDMIKKIHFPLDVYYELADYCAQQNIAFLSSPFDHRSIEFLKTFNMDYFKIPSGEITNKPYLESIAECLPKVILSTGMSTMNEIERAIGILVRGGQKRKDIKLLHCNTEYPTPMGDVNLTAMITMQKEFGLEVGYSDHTLGIEVPLAAVSIGAKVIEKHFTLDKNMEGPDHRASLDPVELKNMVNAIRNIEVALGNGIKGPSNSEKKNMDIARRSLHAITDLVKGHELANDDFIVLRPGDGISSFDIEKLIGKKINRDIQKGEKFSWKDIVR